MDELDSNSLPQRDQTQAHAEGHRQLQLEARRSCQLADWIRQKFALSVPCLQTKGNLHCGVRSFEGTALGLYQRSCLVRAGFFRADISIHQKLQQRETRAAAFVVFDSRETVQE